MTCVYVRGAKISNEKARSELLCELQVITASIPNLTNSPLFPCQESARANLVY